MNEKLERDESFPSKALSFYVLMQYPPFKKAIDTSNQKEFEKIIYEAGIDVKHGYEIVSCEHRPNPDKPFVWHGPRVEGYERLDEDYIKSGIASWEAILETCDKELRIDLKTMGRESNNIQDIKNHCKNK